MSEYDDNYNDDYEWQQQREEFQKFEKNAARYVQEKQAKAVTEDQKKIFYEALAEHGLTEAEYNQLAGLDPQFVREAYKDHVRSMVATVRTRQRDPRTGQFVKQGFQGHQAAPTAPHAASNSRIEELKARAKAGKNLDDYEQADLLDGMIGKLF